MSDIQMEFTCFNYQECSFLLTLPYSMRLLVNYELIYCFHDALH